MIHLYSLFEYISVFIPNYTITISNIKTDEHSLDNHFWKQSFHSIAAFFNFHTDFGVLSTDHTSFTTFYSGFCSLVRECKTKRKHNLLLLKPIFHAFFQYCYPLWTSPDDYLISLNRPNQL